MYAPSHTRSQWVHSARELVDPATDRRVLLIGTLNASSLQCSRTLDALRQFKPEALIVQIPEKWFNYMHAVHGGNAQLSQKDIFTTPYNYEPLRPPVNLRSVLFTFRYRLWRFFIRQHLGLFDDTGDIFKPGIEVYRAVELMRRLQVPVTYCDFEFGKEALMGLETETGMNFLDFFMKNYLKSSFWTRELQDLQERIALRGFTAFAEHADDKTMIWLAKLMEKICPLQKRILLDRQDEVFFHELFQAKERRVACLLNYWHVPGVEYLWRTATETHKREFINPVGDFDINALVSSAAANEKLQRLATSLARTELATQTDYITQYFKQATEWERERHGYFLGHSDPAQEHLLYNGENDRVEHLTYKRSEH